MKYLTTLIIGMFFLPAYAQNEPEEVLNIRLDCYNTKQILNDLQKTYKEVPIIIGRASDQAGSTMTFWMNTTEKTWTILATKSDITCIVGVGTDAEISTGLTKKR